MMDRSDYPDCIFCGHRTSWAQFDYTMRLLVFHCSNCGQSVEVEIKNEGLLRDSGSR
jgi:transcription elongation factor Elf1